MNKDNFETLETIAFLVFAAISLFLMFNSTSTECPNSESSLFSIVMAVGCRYGIIGVLVLLTTLFLPIHLLIKYANSQSKK